MASLVVAGDVSGSVTLSAPSAAGSTVITLPTTSGTMVVTGGAQTVQFAAGSAASPSITFTGDTNTGIFSPAADTIAFSEGGVESMRIDSSGNVGIGTSSPAIKLEVNGTGELLRLDGSANQNRQIYLRNVGTGTAKIHTDGTMTVGSNAAYPLTFITQDAERMRITSGGNVAIATTSSQSGLEIYRANSTTGSLTDASLMLSTTATTGRKVNIGFGLGAGVANTCAAVIGYDVTNGSGAGLGDIFFSTRNTTADSTPTERMRITSAGNLLVATTSFTSPYPSAYTAPGIGLGTKTPITWNSTNSAIWGGGGGVDDRLYAAAGNGVIIYSNTNLNVGVQLTGGANSWSSVSDESLKTDLIPIQNATEKVSSLRAVTGRYKTDDETVSRAFLIAQDVQKVLPEAVSEDEETGILNLRYTETIPLLVAAIQELNAKVEAQAAEIVALKGAN